MALGIRNVSFYNFELDRLSLKNGKVAEWSNAPDSKSGIRLYRIEGSNPSLSAIFFSETIQDNLRHGETFAFKAPPLLAFRALKFPLCNFRLRHDETRKDIILGASGGQIGGQN